MTPDELAHIIQLILAPAVMITASAITLSGIMGHYQAVSNRLRNLARERIDLLRAKDGAGLFTQERLTEIDYQAPNLLRRHVLIHNSLLAIDAAMAVFVLCMLAIAVDAASGSGLFAVGVLGLFLLGTLLLLVGVVLSAIDLGISRRAVAFEVERVMNLTREP